MLNQNPEQKARDLIDQQLIACGWVIQHKSAINLAAATGVAVREYQTDKGPADYVMFVDKKHVGIIETKRTEEAVHLTVHEEQILDYFDLFKIGLTATPDNCTFGCFNKNIVSDYGYEKAVIDGVLVPYSVFSIETKITKQGGAIAMGEMVDKWERLARRKFWETADEDIEYSGKQLDRDIVNKSQIRTIIRAVKDNLEFGNVKNLEG